ncbi:protein of unassigned function [Methylobacterium oryzae CBMB20]|uniref:Protein of unassigned function n=3 Tax=Methylobacterium TaxID=407 RepID=A0A089P055_9HYPH|nr:protein of unassigned function [Methylobacterium oryzae CBMB20]
MMVPASSPGPARTHKPPPGAASKDALYRIAGILDVPVASFFPDADRPDAAIAQAADLVSAFVAIENPAARRTCLAFVRAMAGS